MKKRRKLLVLAVLVAVVGAAGAYQEVLHAAPVRHAPNKINGTLVQLTPAFTVNLEGGHYGLVTVALLLTHAPAPVLDSDGNDVITLPENAAVRAVITNDLTGLDPQALIDRASRQQVEQEILRDLKNETDEPVTRVFFTDLAVQ